MKNIGEVAYTTWVSKMWDHDFNPARYPAYEKLPEAAKAGWQEIAEAVVLAQLRNMQESHREMHGG